MISIRRVLLLCGLLMLLTCTAQRTPTPRFRVLVLYEDGGHHKAFTDSAKFWLSRLAADSAVQFDYIKSASEITTERLASYQLLLQLDYVPYGWPEAAKQAFINYIQSGNGGWVGLHHAGLLGDFDGYKMWPWFSDFLGGIQYKDYIAGFASATVNVEQSGHPIVKGVPASFFIPIEEWYTWDKSPRPGMSIIANVDESTYSPDSDKKMGDHPVIWSNPNVRARNVYIFMGHSPALLKVPAYSTLLTNAIFWAASSTP